MGNSVTAKLNTVVALSNVGSRLNHGKWQTAPSPTLGVGDSQIFVAENDGPNLPEGWVAYQAADGTKFTFNFDDPPVEANRCSTVVENLSGPWTITTPSFPTAGRTWTVTYYIGTSAKLFVDAPVFPEDVIKAGKCDAFPKERIVKLIGDKKCLYLKDALETDQLKPGDKLWCVTQGVFLTPASRALLTRDLVQVALQESPAARSVLSMVDSALQAHADFFGGQAGLSKLQAMQQTLHERIWSLKSAEPRDRQILDVVGALSNADSQAGWANAVSSFLHDAEGKELLQRQNEILALVERRL